MRLFVLVTFLLALAQSSGLRCQTAQKNQEGFSEFSKKHILAIDIKGNWKVNYLNKVFKEYLQRHDLCGRVDLQTFFRRSDTERVEKVCSDKGFEYDGNNKNLCISEQQFTVYMVESEKIKNSCKIQSIDIKTQYVVLGCGKIKNYCLPVHFETQTNVPSKLHAPLCNL